MKFVPAFLALLASLCLPAAADTPLSVSAATSLRDVLTEIEALYVRDHPDVSPTIEFTGSGTIQRQIETGARIDVFISASPKEILALERKNLLVRGSTRNIVKNTLVLIVPKDSTTVTSFADLAKPEVRRIAIGAPRTVAVGTYTVSVFAMLKLTDAVRPKLVELLDVRQVLAQVAAGEADAGVLYETDARKSAEVRIAATADPKTHQMIVYPCAIPKASRQKAAAEAFAAFLLSPAAQEIFAKHGFLPAS